MNGWCLWVNVGKYTILGAWFDQKYIKYHPFIVAEILFLFLQLIWSALTLISSIFFGGFRESQNTSDTSKFNGNGMTWVPQLNKYLSSYGEEMLISTCGQHMGVSKNRGTPKWMVKIMEHPIKMDDLGETHYFWKHPYRSDLSSQLLRLNYHGTGPGCCTCFRWGDLFIGTLDGGPIRIWSHSWGWFYRSFFCLYISAGRRLSFIHQKHPELSKDHQIVLPYPLNLNQPLGNLDVWGNNIFPWVMTFSSLCKNNAWKFQWMAHQVLGIREHLGHLIIWFVRAKLANLCLLPGKHNGDSAVFQAEALLKKEEQKAGGGCSTVSKIPKGPQVGWIVQGIIVTTLFCGDYVRNYEIRITPIKTIQYFMESRAFVLFFFVAQFNHHLGGSYPAWWFSPGGHVNPGPSDVSEKGATFTHQQLGINNQAKLFSEMDKSKQLGSIRDKSSSSTGKNHLVVVRQKLWESSGEVDERGELSIGSLTRGFLAMPVVLDSFEVVMGWELTMTSKW